MAQFKYDEGSFEANTLRDFPVMTQEQAIALYRYEGYTVADLIQDNGAYKTYDTRKLLTSLGY